MRLSDCTDHTLRVPMYCAAHRDRLVTIAELADMSPACDTVPVRSVRRRAASRAI